MPRLSIIIVTYNSRHEIDACLESLDRDGPGVEHEIVVVDNASPDGTAAHLREGRTRARVIDAGGNLGFSRANNLALRETSSELVLLLNPDTVVHRGAIDRLVQTLDAAAGVAAAGPRLVDGSGRAELSFGRMIGPLAELRQMVLVRAQDAGRAWVIRRIERMTSRERDVDWVSGACLLARRADAEKVGYFDERFFMYGEDVDFCASIRGLGRAVRFVPEATVTHLRGRSAASAPAATLDAYRRSQIAFYEKHLPGWVPVLRLYLRLRGQLPGRLAGGEA